MNWYYYDETGQHDWVSGDPLPDGADIFNTEFLQQFYERCYDISLIIAYDLSATPNIYNIPQLQAGDDVSFNLASTIVSRIINMQQVFDTLLLRTHPDYQTEYVFIDSTSDIIGLATAIYKTGNDLLVNANLPEYSDDYITCLTEGFFKPRRTKIHPSDASFVDFEYGAFLAGDIIGSWIFEDIRLIADQINYILVALSYDLAGFFRPSTQSISRQAIWDVAPYDTWSTSSWQNAGANTFNSQGSYIGGFGAWNITAHIDRFGLDYSQGSVIGATSWRNRQLNYSLLNYPNYSNGSVLPWTLGVDYYLYSVRNSGSITNWGEIDMGYIFDQSLVLPPYNASSPGSFTTQQSFANLAAPEVMAQKTVASQTAGASVLLSIQRL